MFGYVVFWHRHDKLLTDCIIIIFFKSNRLLKVWVYVIETVRIVKKYPGWIIVSVRPKGEGSDGPQCFAAGSRPVSCPEVEQRDC